ncbi:hypothetical protein BRADI_5g24873v3 [Brachypodium distachyon]|uniref:Uncharacterized protein n=1 Tax=Brachypodium distachyon TaxID=15368 RepID=A0A0Q3P7W0_BRADI|nr:hypothetical protein BRADI_5g24873v3 [Brachypodium distachyon]
MGIDGPEGARLVDRKILCKPDGNSLRKNNLMVILMEPLMTVNHFTKNVLFLQIISMAMHIFLLWSS